MLDNISARGLIAIPLLATNGLLEMSLHGCEVNDAATKPKDEGFKTWDVAAAAFLDEVHDAQAGALGSKKGWDTKADAGMDKTAKAEDGKQYLDISASGFASLYGFDNQYSPEARAQADTRFNEMAGISEDPLVRWSN